MSERRLRVTGWFRAHPWVTDSLIAAAVVAPAVIGLFVPATLAKGVSARDPDGWAVLLAIVSAAPLAARRRFPVTVMAITGGATTLLSVLHYVTGSTGLGVLLATYTVGTSSASRAAIEAIVATEFFIGVSVANNPETRAYPLQQAVGIAVVNMSVFLAAWIAGRYIRTRRAYIAEVEARAVHSEGERVAQTRAALAEERERIAREMHDVVAHHVTVMVVSATAARRTRDRDPAKADELLSSIEASGRAALTEMRRIVGYLREDDTPGRRPQSGLDHIDAVVRSICDAGVPVQVRVIGTPVALPPTVDTTAYRVVQEALTNVLKHASPASARLTIHYEEGSLVLHVVDDGAPRELPSARSSPAGHGLSGMRERVTLLGGQVRAGPLPSGGFDVHVRLPLGAWQQ